MKSVFHVGLLAGFAFIYAAQAQASDATIQCTVEPARFIVGKTLTPSLQQQAREAADASSVVVNYMLLDHRSDRLQISTDNGVVRDVRCG